MNLTPQLGQYAARIPEQKLARQTLESAKKCILDWAGVCIRGSQEKPIRILRTLLARGGDANEATVLTEPAWRTTAWDAALLNGAASHSLDFDDLHNASIIHLGTVVIPAALAVAEAEGADGNRLLQAVVTGYEVGARVGESIIPESYHYWHTTGTAGIFGAAAAAGSVLGLNAEQMVQCWGTAGTQAAGLWEFLAEGAMSKTVHAGKAAYAGVLSAYLAQQGFTGATHILEGEKGFCRALSTAPHWHKLTDGLDYTHYKIDDNSFKPYACCKHSHAAIYGTIELLAQRAPERIAEIKVYVNEITDSLINNADPQTAYGCKFSIQYCIAAAAIHGEVGIDLFTESAIHDPQVRALMKKVTVIHTAEMDRIKEQDATKLASKIEIRFTDGETAEMLVEYPKGDPANSLSVEEMEAKFMSLTVPVIGEEKAKSLAELILRAEEVTDLGKALRQVFPTGR